MRICDVTTALAPLKLGPPDLEMLRPTEARYTCLLVQPSGPIFAGRQRIGQHEPVAGALKARQFLQLALGKHAHLAVTPEYFFPWDALKVELLAGTQPSPGNLWVLGCESIDAPALAKFQADVGDVCDVVHEPIAGLPADRALFDPVVHIFQASREDGTFRLVALVQFKTCPSRDDTFFEEGLLRRGTTVYKFKGQDGTLSVSTIICSDAFALTDAVMPELVDRSTLIHIQLNPDPRNSAYRQYRKTTFETDPSTSECHIVCLNWAGAVVQHGETGPLETWPKVAGSAWYCPDSRCKSDDEIVLPNHDLGLYYAYMQERRHALLFDYGEAAFELQIPKVVTRGKAVLANKNGPSAVERYCWNPGASAWAPGTRPVNAGFEALLRGNPEALAALSHATQNGSPLDTERLLALTVGSANGMESWFSAKEVDSCRIGADEVVKRVTVAQDNHADAVSFRYARIESAAELRHLLDTKTDWPPQLAGVAKDSLIHWSANDPHFNVRTSDGRPSLIVNLGNAPEPRRLENTASKFVELLRKDGSRHKDRLCIVYSRLGELKFAPLPSTRFDDALGDETDLLAVQPLE